MEGSLTTAEAVLDNGRFGTRTVRFETNHYFDVLRMLNYVT